MLAKAADHDIVTEATVVLDIEVETINHHVSERTGPVGLGPLLGDRTERTPKEIGKGDSRGLVLNQLVVGSGTSQRKHHGLPSLLADGDILPNLVASLEQLRRDTTDCVVGTIALVAEVATRPARSTLVWEPINEAKIDDIQGGFLTEMSQTLLAITLTIIHGNVGIRLNVQSRRERS
jgi:hypothetical protein